MSIHTYNLQLKDPFTISRGTRTEVASLIVELNENGLSGFGEATANPYYHTDIFELKEQLQSKSAIIEVSCSKHPEEFWEYVSSHFQNPFLLCALDEAYNDLYTKIRKLKLYEFWGFVPNASLMSNYTIGIDTIETMIRKMKEVDYPIYKIKLGTPDDLKIIKELRANSNAVFRIDANCAWTVEETIKNSFELKKLGVEFIEQPLKAENVQGAKEVFHKSQLPIIADESCISEADVEKCIGSFHGINVKLMKCGGPTPAKRMLLKAKTNGLKTMVGCMTESTVGISAIAHLTPLLDYVDMDGALLLKNDIATGVKLNKGKIVFAGEYGTGAKLLSHNK